MPAYSNHRASRCMLATPSCISLTGYKAGCSVHVQELLKALAQICSRPSKIYMASTVRLAACPVHWTKRCAAAFSVSNKSARHTLPVLQVKASWAHSRVALHLDAIWL